MHWALVTCWFLLLISTFVKAFSGIFQKVLTVIAEGILGIMHIVTMHSYHCLDCFLFPINARLLTKHVEHL